MRSLELYNLNTVLDFGKYKGSYLSNVVDEFPGYVRWCLINVDWFVIDQNELDEAFPENDWSQDFLVATENKWNLYTINESSNCVDDYDMDYYESESYGEYAGTYAQDVEGLSDDFINDVFGGEPDAYWNID